MNKFYWKYLFKFINLCLVQNNPSVLTPLQQTYHEEKTPSPIYYFNEFNGNDAAEPNEYDVIDDSDLDPD